MTQDAASRIQKVERPAREAFEQAWMDPDTTQKQIAEMFGLSRTTCGAIAAEFGLPYRSRFSNRIGTSNAVEDPSPDEIAERCAEIRKRWSDSERRRRALGNIYRPSMIKKA